MLHKEGILDPAVMMPVFPKRGEDEHPEMVEMAIVAAKEAMAQAGKTAADIDLIISDVNMPRMDGFTFIKTVREQDAYRDLPIVVLSTEGQEKDIQKGITLGANLYMVKPAQPQQMVRNIKMLLG